MFPQPSMILEGWVWPCARMCEIQIFVIGSMLHLHFLLLYVVRREKWPLIITWDYCVKVFSPTVNSTKGILNVEFLKCYP